MTFTTGTIPSAAQFNAAFDAKMDNPNILGVVSSLVGGETVPGYQNGNPVSIPVSLIQSENPNSANTVLGNVVWASVTEATILSLVELIASSPSAINLIYNAMAGAGKFSAFLEA